MSTGMKSTPTRKLRTLCFHGYLQNAQVTAVLKCAAPHDHLASTAVQPASELQIISKCLLATGVFGKDRIAQKGSQVTS